MSDVMLRLATGTDAAALARFGREVFVRTFGPDNHPRDIHAYVDEAFTETAQAAEIADPASFTILAMEDDGSIAGYALVTRGAPEIVQVGEAPIQIRRFYIAHEHHGRGLAARLMQDVIERSRERGARTLWLGVWEHNERAIAFYQKHGFVQAGTQPFLLGSDLQSDWVMQNTTALR
jgi:diamine N-acetyltransferase